MLWGVMNELCDQNTTAALMHKVWTATQYGGSSYDQQVLMAKLGAEDAAVGPGRGSTWAAELTELRSPKAPADRPVTSASNRTSRIGPLIAPTCGGRDLRLSRAGHACSICPKYTLTREPAAVMGTELGVAPTVGVDRLVLEVQQLQRDVLAALVLAMHLQPLRLGSI